MNSLKTRSLILSALGGTALLLAGSLSAATIDCDVTQAAANNEVADSCRATGTNLPGPTNETDFVNTNFQGVDEDPFVYTAKWNVTNEEDESFKGAQEFALEGFGLVVTLDGYEVTDVDDNVLYTYTFFYALSVPDDLDGIENDFVLGVKQATSFFAYLFEGTTLPVEGGFNSFTVSSGEQISANDFSHVTVFLRDSDDGLLNSDIDLPEPATFALFGGGLLALGWAMRRRNRVI